MILVSVERGDSTLYYGTNNYTFGVSVSNKITGGGNPLIGRRVRKKGSGRRGLIYKYDFGVYNSLPKKLYN